jgi:glycosyltransferase involved in cell wall biosynthesis
MLPAVATKKILIISMGIDYAAFVNQRRRLLLQPPLKIVFVGRLTEIKGIRYLIDAMSILREQNIKFTLDIYGDGILKNMLVDRVYELGLSESIFFNGFVGHDELPKKLMEQDVFVGPSITTSLGETEGLGLVFLEAMAAGLVVIGTNVGGISEIIKDKETGLLVAEKDPDAIAKAILLLSKDDNLRRHIITNGKELCRQYDWAIIASKYYYAYESED